MEPHLNPQLSVKYRRMHLGDALAVNILDQRNFDDHLKLSNVVLDFLYDARLSFVCTVGNRIVGAILAEERKDSVLDGTRGYVMITSLCVEECYSGRGIGRKLMEYCMRAARDVNEAVYLTVNQNNHGAIRLYESVGFVTVRVEKNMYFDGSAGVLMKHR